MIGMDAGELRAVDAADEDVTLPPAQDASSGPTWLAVVPWMALAVAVVWIIGMAWLARDAVSIADPVGLASFVAALCVVPGVVGIGWLVLARADGRYAARIVAQSRAMRAETLALSGAVEALAGTLAVHRGALAEQAGALEALSERTAQRLASIGRGLSEEIDQADIHARALGEAADTAGSKLAVLLATMPRAASEAAALGENVERIGLAAGAQIATLDARLAALSERGREAEALASGGAATLAAHIARMEATSETAGARLDAVTAAMASQIDGLLDRTAAAVDESRKGIAAQGDAMLAMIGTHQTALDVAARESAEALAERIAIVESVIDRVGRRLATQREAGDALARDMEGWIEQVEQQLDTMQRDGTRRADALARSIAALGGHAEAMTAALRTGDDAAVKAITSAETLLIALDSAAREMDETLTLALGRLDSRLDATRERIGATRPELLTLVTASETTHAAIEAVAALLERQRREAEETHALLASGLDAGEGKARAIEASVDTSIARVEVFAEQAAPRLLESLLRVKDTSAVAADHARETLAAVIPEAAAAMESAGSAALRRATESGFEARIAGVSTMAETAVAAASAAADRLEGQIARIDAAIRQIDTRLATDRAARETAERESFARRSALLIDALHSASIDITRSLAPEIGETAWAAYLKGDRGAFTRRAVRLLDAGAQREVATLYDGDATFRDQVNAYVHDFESMLRTVLAQREASPLGVTLLSSDIGKLYVALAQAIERLR